MAASDPAQTAPRHLLKILGLTFGVAVALGNMIGSGILRAPSSIAGAVPSVAIIMGLWVLGAIQMSLAANVYSELGAALPRASADQVACQRAFGDIGGLLVGWSGWIANVAGAAANSIAFASFLPLIWPWAGGHLVGIATAVLIAMFGANSVGVREGRVLQEATSFFKAMMLVAFCIAAAMFVPSDTGILTAQEKPALIGWSSLLVAYQMIRGAYAGWSLPVSFAEELVDPGRTIPRTMFWGIALTACLYLAVNGALLYALGVHGVAATALPFTTVLAPMGPLAQDLFALTAMVTVAGCANASIMANPRTLYALAQQGLMPRLFAGVNKGGSPVAGFVFTAAATIALALTGSFELVFSLIGTVNGIAAVIVIAALFVLRRREPDLPRPYRAVLYPALPLISIVFEIVALLLYSAADVTGILFAIGLCLACIPFALVARRGRIRLGDIAGR